MKIICFGWRKVSKITFIAFIAIIINLVVVKYTNYSNLCDIDGVSMTNLAGKKVVIDPGHGGIDSGASNKDIEEKSTNLAIALKLAEIIKNYGGTVLLTRDSDIDYYTRGKGGKRNDLKRRVEIINNAGADVFISIHANSYKASTQLSGAQVFYSLQNSGNKELAEIIQYVLADCPQGNKFKIKEDSHLFLLKETKAKGILVETGYISNLGEAVNLSDTNYQQKLAVRIAQGLAYYFYKCIGRYV